MTEAKRPKIYRGSLAGLTLKMNEARGIDLSHYRSAYLERRVSARVRALELHSFRQYIDYLDEHPGEYAELLDALTINVTDFFRDKSVWDTIRRKAVMPMLEHKKEARGRTIRIWSAGCATGEEPYSLAMLMLDVLGTKASDFILSVTATDLDDEALRRARAGIYDNEKLKGIPPSYQVRFTRKADESSFQVAPEVRGLVRFSQANLSDAPPMRMIDLLLCRNVFIYLDRDQQAKVLDMFWDALTKGGFLVLGRSEKLSPEMAEALLHIDGRERVYRKPLVL